MYLMYEWLKCYEMEQTEESSTFDFFKNISGQGIDNHLCALRRISSENGETPQTTPSLFTDPMWEELMRFPLSTSQVQQIFEFLKIVGFLFFWFKDPIFFSDCVLTEN